MKRASSSRAALAWCALIVGVAIPTELLLEGRAEAADKIRDAAWDKTESASDVNENVSSLALTTIGMIRAGATFGSGTRPAWVSPTTRYSIQQYGLEFHYSDTLDDDQNARPLGTALALEYHVGAFYSDEDPVMRDRDPLPFELVGSVGLAGRVLSFGDPKRLALVVHANLEASLGGQYWWSDTPRATILAGPRILSKWGDSTAAELGYAFVPNYLTGSPEDIEVDRWEHRITAGISTGYLGIGIRHVLATERTKTPFPDILRSHASSTFFYVELRDAE